MTSYPSLNESRFAHFRSGLLSKKGSDKQIDFLSSLSSREGFLRYTEILWQGGEANFNRFLDPLTENCFGNPPPNIQESTYSIFGKIPYKYAASPTLWGAITLLHIQNEIIEADYLVGPNVHYKSGMERIDHALHSNDVTEIDNCVRTALRQLSGLPEARGKRSVFIDCPFARSWWKSKIISSVKTNIIDSDKLKLFDVFKNKAIWESFVTTIVSRPTVLGSEIMQDAFVYSFAKLMTNEQVVTLHDAKKIKVALVNISNVTSGVEYSTLEYHEVIETIHRILKKVNIDYS